MARRHAAEQSEGAIPSRRQTMDYEKGYVYQLMDQGGPTDNREPYFKDAVDEMMRVRVL
jgi:hypothetical protein